MTGFSAWLAAGLALLAVAAVVDLVVGVRRPRLAALPYLAGAAGSVCLVAGGAGALAGHPAKVWPAGVLGPGTAGLSADRLSGLFLMIAFGAAAWVSLGFADWLRRGGRGGKRQRVCILCSNPCWSARWACRCFRNSFCGWR